MNDYIVRNEDISTTTLVKYLLERATEEGTEGEFNPKEHTLWMAAERLEDFTAIIMTDNIPQRLRTIAALLEQSDE